MSWQPEPLTFTAEHCGLLRAAPASSMVWFYPAGIRHPEVPCSRPITCHPQSLNVSIIQSEWLQKGPLQHLHVKGTLFQWLCASSQWPEVTQQNMSWLCLWLSVEAGVHSTQGWVTVSFPCLFKEAYKDPHPQRKNEKAHISIFVKPYDFRIRKQPSAVQQSQEVLSVLPVQELPTPSILQSPGVSVHFQSCSWLQSWPAE